MLSKFVPKYSDSYTSIKSISNNANEYFDKVITCKGWVQTFRKQSSLCFVQIYDGSTGSPLQIVFTYSIPILNIGSCIEVTGKIIKSPAKGQLFEMVIDEDNEQYSYKILGDIKDTSTYIPNVKGMKIENLRYENAFLKPKFQSVRSIFRIRNALFQAFHTFFQQNNFLQIDPNVLTTSDCEGAGEVFTVTTSEDKNKKTEETFFKKPVYLTVSSQLQLEALCSGLSKVYTLNPSFRAEKSHTNRHVACFTHLEWEIAFLDLKSLLDFNEDIVVYAISYILDNCKEDLNNLNKFLSQGLIQKLENTIKEPFMRVSYDEALKELENNEEKLKEMNISLPKWGDDLGSDCEKFLCEQVYKKPTLVYNYPSSLKSFYMKQNEDGKTCQSCDLLMPTIGEIIGSSVREENYEKLIKIMEERKMDTKPLEWYLDLRKNGSFPHGGAGLGFDRLLSYLTLNEGSIKDVIPFSVSYENCWF